MRCIMHITKEVASPEEAAEWYQEIKGELKHHPDVHINGQVTVKFDPSHPPGTPEEGPPP